MGDLLPTAALVLGAVAAHRDRFVLTAALFVLAAAGYQATGRLTPPTAAVLFGVAGACLLTAGIRRLWPPDAQQTDT